MNFDRPPHEEDVVIEKELPIADQEQLEGEVVVDERYKKEIRPLIKILKPEGVSLEEYENQFMDELYEDTKKIQTAKGVLLASPDEEIEDMKALLISRFRMDTHKVQGHLESDEQVNKAAAALIASGNIDDNWTYNQQGFRGRQREIGQYIKPLIKEYIKNSDFESVKHLLENIDKVGETVDARLYYSFTPELMGGELNFAQDVQKEILTGEMPSWVFRRYNNVAHNDEIFQTLVPQEYRKYELINSYAREIFSTLNPFDEASQTEDFETFEKIRNMNTAEAEKFVEAMDKESIDRFTATILAKRKSVISSLEPWEKREMLYLFNKNDYQEFFDKHYPVTVFSPDALPKNLDPESKSLLVEKWKEFIEEDPDPSRIGPELMTILNFLPEEEVTDLFERNVLSELRVAPHAYLASQKEKVVRLFDGYKKLSPDQQQELAQKVTVQNFTEYAQIIKFDAEKMDQLIEKLGSVPREQVEEYLQEEITLEISSDNIFAKGKTRYDMLDMYTEHARNENDPFADIKMSKLESIKAALLLNENDESIPQGFLEKKNEFKDKYGIKGESLVTLAVAAYGVENLELFEAKMKIIEKVLDKYNPETIPEGSNVSMGIEYEVTKSLSVPYAEESILGYKKDAALISEAASIGKGRDAVHEFALKPTYNPYMLLAEVKLMQDAGLLDLNFEKYSEAARGYHLSLVGDSGLEVDKNIQFLNNLLTMTQLSGALAGNEIHSTKQVHTKGFDIFSSHAQNGKRCEFKGMACDTVEQFEKAVVTAHNAGIAIQLSNKYLPSIEMGTAIGSSPEEFESIVQMTGALTTPFESDQERDIVYSWIRLKNAIISAIETHNESFIDSEFNGFVLDNEGNYIDTGEHIDVIRNKNLIDMEIAKTPEFKQLLRVSPTALFHIADKSFVNPLIRTNNIFLKPPQGGENSAVNARAMLDVVKEEGYGDIQDGMPTESIFDRGGEFRDGYYVVQGASEEMITHKSQIVLSHFNRAMEQLLQQPGIRREIPEDNLVTA